MDLSIQSESIESLAVSLVAAQSVIEDAKMDKINPHFKNKYATLDAILEAIRKPLTDNGLAITQTMMPGNLLVTTLVHRSGQWIRSYMDLNPQRLDPQGIGSALTYARRYALAAIVGISQEDDDGEMAMVKPKPKDEKVFDIEKLGPTQFYLKVKEEINNTMSNDDITTLLKEGGYSWTQSKKQDMFDYLKSYR